MLSGMCELLRVQMLRKKTARTRTPRQSVRRGKPLVWPDACAFYQSAVLEQWQRLVIPVGRVRPHKSTQSVEAHLRLFTLSLITMGAQEIQSSPSSSCSLTHKNQHNTTKPTASERRHRGFTSVKAPVYGTSNANTHKILWSLFSCRKRAFGTSLNKQHNLLMTQ